MIDDVVIITGTDQESPIVARVRQLGQRILALDDPDLEFAGQVLSGAQSITPEVDNLLVADLFTLTELGSLLSLLPDDLAYEAKSLMEVTRCQ